MTLFLLGLLFGVAVGALGASALARARLLSRLARPSIRSLAGGPYRHQLDVVQDAPRKVYCKDCKHFLDRHDGPHLVDRCVLGDETEDPVKGVYRKTRDFAANKNYDCKDWEAK
ncbi:MAG: hypothetical protein AMXMBFR56_62180 [Polyangiaceae bacterium]